MKIGDSSFVIETNGFADGPAQPLRDYLLAHDAKKVIMLSHPLVGEGDNHHVLVTYENGKEPKTKKYRLPNKPPYTFALDPFVPFNLPPSTAWFAFNNLATLKGLRHRKRGKTEKVYYWAVDFVPNRFGSSPLTKIYDRFDRRAVVESDGRIELSQAALEGRNKSMQLDLSTAAPAYVVPMGAWLGRTPKANTSSWKKRKIVYMGHLVERQGVHSLLEALALLQKSKYDFTADIVGGGPEEQSLRQQAKKLGLGKQVTFHGFVKEYRDVEKILGEASLAVAPFVKSKENFTQFADPNKLKSYLGAGLPIVLTDVPPNAHELARAGAGYLVDDSPEAIAAGIKHMLDEKSWSKAHQAANAYAKGFDWENILGDLLKKLGFTAQK